MAVHWFWPVIIALPGYAAHSSLQTFWERKRQVTLGITYISWLLVASRWSGSEIKCGPGKFVGHWLPPIFFLFLLGLASGSLSARFTDKTHDTALSGMLGTTVVCFSPIMVGVLRPILSLWSWHRVMPSQTWGWLSGFCWMPPAHTPLHVGYFSLVRL